MGSQHNIAPEQDFYKKISYGTAGGRLSIYR
jgi:hypothetical protein